MSKTNSRRLLWLALALLLPVPMWFIGPGNVPALVLLQVSAYMGAVLVVDWGPGAYMAFWVIGLQGLIWVAILYGVARVTTALLARMAGGTPPVAVIGAIALALLGVSMFDIYQAAFIAHGGPVNLLGVY